MKARAKINLTLDIVSKREDGYHEISSVMQTLSLCDKVYVKPSKEITVTDNIGIDNENNICHKAAKAFFEYTKINGGAEIKIIKRIPVLAGLGGGSADAAAVINKLNKLYKTNLDKKELRKIAASVGADVPFLITGGTAKVCGIGEKVYPLKTIKNRYVVLVKEKSKQSTAKSYGDFDSFGKSNPKTENFCKALESKEDWIKFVGNDFLSIDPQTELINDIKATNPLCVSLSGSGPVVFALFSSMFAAKAAAKSLRKKGREIIISKLL